jgi:enoyl reductase-like protein
MKEIRDRGIELHFDDLSREMERCWRIVTFPQNHSDLVVRMAAQFLEQTGDELFDLLPEDSLLEEEEIIEALDLGLFHYAGKVLPSREINHEN